MTKEQDDSGFRVTDKRTFRENGERRQSDEAEPAREQHGSKPLEAEGFNMQAGEGEAEPRIDFPSYTLSYYTQGLVLLGEVPNPMTNKREEDLEGARHTIDILAMLKDKTKGNLSKEEDQLLGSVLYELQMKFMAKSQKFKF